MGSAEELNRGDQFFPLLEDMGEYTSFLKKMRIYEIFIKILYLFPFTSVQSCLFLVSYHSHITQALNSIVKIHETPLNLITVIFRNAVFFLNLRCQIIQRQSKSTHQSIQINKILGGPPLRYGYNLHGCNILWRC